MLEIWADRGHFLYDYYKISNNFYDLFRQISPRDLAWLDPTGCSIIHATDSYGDRHISEVGLVPGGERLPDKNKTRMCNHFAAVEYQMRYRDTTTLKEKPWYFIFQLSQWLHTDDGSGKGTTKKAGLSHRFRNSSCSRKNFNTAPSDNVSDGVLGRERETLRRSGDSVGRSLVVPIQSVRTYVEWLKNYQRRDGARLQPTPAPPPAVPEIGRDELPTPPWRKKVRFNDYVEVMSIPANDGEGRKYKHSVKAQHPGGRRFHAEMKIDADGEDEEGEVLGAGSSSSQGRSSSPWAQPETEYHYIGSKRGFPASSQASSPTSSDTERKKRTCDRDASVAQSSDQDGVPKVPMPKRAPPPPPDSIMMIDGIALTSDDLDNGLPWEKLTDVQSILKDEIVWPFSPPRSFSWAGSPRYLLFGSVGGCVRYVREDMTRSRQIRAYRDLSYQGEMPKTAKGPLVRSFLFPGYHEKKDHAFIGLMIE